MSKEKVNGVESTPIETSKEGTEQVKDKVLEVSSAYNSPRIQRDVWNRVRIDFDLQNFKSLKELSKRHGVDYQALRQKVYGGKWKEEQSALQRKVMQKVQDKVLTEVERQSSYLLRLSKRTEKMEQIIDASLEQAGSKDAHGVNVLDLEAIDVVTRSEARLVDMNRVAYRIPTMSSQDITSAGADLGTSFIQAIAKLRANPEKLQSQDLDKVLEAEVE